MESYLGIKMINAKPLNRLEYNQFRGWDLPNDENGDDKGYLVEYIDGGKANTKEYKGYVSWSPKDVFEKAYTPIYQVYMTLHKISTLTDEQIEIHEDFDNTIVKVDGIRKKLEATNYTDKLLWDQFNYLRGYVLTLVKVINNFKIESEDDKC